MRIRLGLVLALPMIFMASLAFLGSGPWIRIQAVAIDATGLYFGIGGSGSAKSASSDFVRASQGSELMQGWSAHPFFGSGMGAVLDTGYYRSAERPWMFELQYHQLLFDGGLVAVVLVAVALVIGIVQIRRVALRMPEHRPLLVATTTAAFSLLAANASNPYMQADGHWWGAVLVLGVANALARSVSGGGHHGELNRIPTSIYS